MDLTNEQWAILELLIPEPPRRPDGRGRPWKPARDVLNGVLWVLPVSTVPDLPSSFPALGARRGHGQDLALLGPGPERARRPGRAGMLH